MADYYEREDEPPKPKHCGDHAEHELHRWTDWSSGRWVKCVCTGNRAHERKRPI